MVPCGPRWRLQFHPSCLHSHQKKKKGGREEKQVNVSWLLRKLPEAAIGHLSLGNMVTSSCKECCDRRWHSGQACTHPKWGFLHYGRRGTWLLEDSQKSLTWKVFIIPFWNKLQEYILEFLNLWCCRKSIWLQVETNSKKCPLRFSSSFSTSLLCGFKEISASLSLISFSIK